MLVNMSACVSTCELVSICLPACLSYVHVSILAQSSYTCACVSVCMFSMCACMNRVRILTPAWVWSARNQRKIFSVLLVKQFNTYAFINAYTHKRYRQKLFNRYIRIHTYYTGKRFNNICAKLHYFTIDEWYFSRNSSLNSLSFLKSCLSSQVVVVVVAKLVMVVTIEEAQIYFLIKIYIFQ